MQHDFQYILLDLDGTVTDSGAGIMNSAAYALEKFGITDPGREKLRAFVGPPLQVSFRELWGFGEEETERAVVYYREYYTKQGMFENRPYPGIEELLEALNKAGRQVILATSKAEVFARTILDHFGLTEYFSLVCGCELDGTRSAKAEVIAYALKQVGALVGRHGSVSPGGCEKAGLNSEPVLFAEAGRSKRAQGNGISGSPEVSEAGLLDRARAVMVGDRKFDVLGAKENGLFAVGAAYGYPEEGELEAAGADAVVESVAQLKAFLLGDR